MLVEFAAGRADAVREVVAVAVAGDFLARVHPRIRPEVASAAVPATRLYRVGLGMPLQHSASLTAAAAAVGFHFLNRVYPDEAPDTQTASTKVNVFTASDAV